MLSYQLLGFGSSVLLCISLGLLVQRIQQAKAQAVQQERIRKASERCKARARCAYSSDKAEALTGRSSGIGKGRNKLPRYGKLRAEEQEWIRQFLGE